MNWHLDGLLASSFTFFPATQNKMHERQLLPPPTPPWRKKLWGHLDWLLVSLAVRSVFHPFFGYTDYTLHDHGCLLPIQESFINRTLEFNCWETSWNFNETSCLQYSHVLCDILHAHRFENKLKIVPSMFLIFIVQSSRLQLQQNHNRGHFASWV